MKRVYFVQIVRIKMLRRALQCKQGYEADDLNFAGKKRKVVIERLDISGV